MEIAGGCLCGSVRYRSTAAPLVTRQCWCRVCQYIGAGSGTVNTCFRTEALTIEGEMRDYSCVADSGNIMHRRFCPSCGTHLFSEAEARPHLIFVRSGTLDDPEIAKPAATIWTSEAPGWACFDERIPKVERQPPPAA
ncbi:MAG: glutathione-dependent formaldehyde-activating enzyme [Gammaproteobacteria bacterium]|nr:glutathione-dependent formaldehyde-activating enzyme [Gammaproteobacteria bacterium]